MYFLLTLISKHTTLNIYASIERFIMKIQKLTLCALICAFICVIAPLSIPMGTVPLTLATFAVYIAASITDISISLPALAGYILLGAFGIPVFSGFAGGLQQLAGVTGGYIIGYIPCLITISLLTRKFPDRKTIYPISMTLGTLVCYIFGTAWYVIQTKSSISSALLLCVVPFIIGDIIKIFAAGIIGYNLRNRLSRIYRKG